MSDKFYNKLEEYWLLLEQELEELFVHGDPKQNNNIIAYRQHLWVLPDEVPAETFNEITKFIGLKNSRNDQDDIEDDFIDSDGTQDANELVNYIIDADRSDILVGHIDNGTLYLRDVGSLKLDPNSSLLVKKVANALKVKKVSYQDDLEGDTNVVVPKKKLIAEIPDIAYHGTSSKYLESILQNGLEPRGHQSNYQHAGIYHEDKIFFSTRFGEASHHAIHTGRQTESFPVVLSFNIPDKNLIIADYDVDMGGGKTTYDAPVKHAHTKYGSEKSYSLSKEFGIYGYLGKIIPQHILYVYVMFNQESYNGAISEYKKFTPKKLKKFLDRMGSFDDLQYVGE